MKTISKLHLYTGLLFLALFLFTGVYMILSFPELYRDNEAMRMMYRSTHIYILMASLINIAIGTYFAPATSQRSIKFQKVGSCLVLISPFLITVAFTLEPPMLALNRPLSFWGILFLLIGVIAHLFSKWGE